MQRFWVVLLLVVFGVLPVTGVLFVALSLLASGPEEPVVTESVGPIPVAVEAPPPETSAVWTAARALPVGALLGKDDLVARDFEVGAVRRGGYFVVEGDGDGTANALYGHAMREAVAEGEPLTPASVVGPREPGFLTAALSPGARAVTIRVGAATGYAGLIDPGDRVDVILTAEIDTVETTNVAFARTIVEDVRVVAVDHRIGVATGPGEGARNRTEITTATLEVSPEQGDRLVLGEHEGNLSLAVRPLAAAHAPLQRTAVDLGNLLRLPVLEPPPPPAPPPPPPAVAEPAPRAEALETTVRVFRGSADAQVVSFDAP